jgi:hypothetical protein
MTRFTQEIRESAPRELGQRRRWQVFSRPALGVPALAIARPGLDHRDGVTPAGQANGRGGPRGSSADDKRVRGHEP